MRSGHYELAMLMKDKNLLLDPSVYYNFDYFVAGSMMIGEIKKNNRVRLSIHSLPIFTYSVIILSLNIFYFNNNC